MKDKSRWPDSGYRRSELFSAKGKGANQKEERNRFPEGDSCSNYGKIMASGGAYGKYSMKHCRQHCDLISTLKIVIVIILFIAVATITCSCMRKTRVEFGKITQGDRINWSVSFGETLIPPYPGENDHEDTDTTDVEEPLLYSLSASDENDVWTAGLFGKIYHFDGLSWTEEGSVDALVRSIYASDSNHLWVGGEETRVDEQGKEGGSAKDVIFFFDGNEWSQQLVFQEEEYGMNGIMSIEGSGPENVWASSFQTLFHYDGQQWNTVYTMGDGSSFDRLHPDLLIERLLVGADGIPVISTSDGFFYYRDDVWNALPDLPNQDASFKCVGLAGSLSDGIWASGPIGEGLEEGESPHDGIVYYYSDGQWETVYECGGSVLRFCVAVTPNTVVVNKHTFKETLDLDTTSMIYFDGSSWSEQGSIDGVLIWGIDSTNGDTIWVSDGERILKGEIEY
jgi:hypothetical protein